MKYSLGKLLVVVTVFGVMAATLRMRSPHSVLVMLACVVGLFGWAAFAAYRAKGTARRVLAAVAISGISYLLFYVFTDTVVEAWINAIAIAPFASMKAGPALSVPAADLRQLSNTMEFQYFHQKMHLMLSVVVACVVGWLSRS